MAEHPRAGVKSPSEREGSVLPPAGVVPVASSTYGGQTKGRLTHRSVGGHSTRSSFCGRNLWPLVSPRSFWDCAAQRTFPGAVVDKERRKGCSQLAGRRWGPVVGGGDPPPNTCVSVLAPRRLGSRPPLETRLEQMQSGKKRASWVRVCDPLLLVGLQKWGVWEHTHLGKTMCMTEGDSHTPRSPRSWDRCSLEPPKGMSFSPISILDMWSPGPQEDRAVF